MMTRCNLKKGLAVLTGAFLLMLSGFVHEAYAANKVVEAEVEAFRKGTVTSDQDKADLLKQYDEAKDKCGASFENVGFWASVKILQGLTHGYAISAEFNSFQDFTKFGSYKSTLGNVLDSGWEIFESNFSDYLGTLEQVKKQIEDYHKDAVQNATTKEAIAMADAKYNAMIKAYDVLYTATDGVRKACDALNAFDVDAHKALVAGIVYKYYICPEGEKDGSEKCQISYYTYDGTTAKTMKGATRGCIPLPMKLAEGRSCIFCPVFKTVFNAAQAMTTKSYTALSKGIANVMLIGFAIWIAFSIMGKVASFTKMDAPKYITELLTQIFKVLIAYLLLRDASALYEYVIGPMLKAGMEFGMTLLSGDNKYLKACNSETVSKGVGYGFLPSYLYTQLDCFIQAVQAELAVPQAIGSSLMCVSRNSGSKDMGVISIITDARLPDLGMFFQGLVIWAFAWLVSLAFAFYLIDATVRLGIIGALMPFLIASWPFKITTKYTGQGWTMFMNTFFTYVFMGLVISINIQLMKNSLSGVDGGFVAVQNALNSDTVDNLKQLLDVGFSGFLILLACCIFGFKLTSQATELAGSMAGGGATSSIAPEMGGTAASVAKAGAQGGAKMAWGGAKMASNATGLTPKLRQARDATTSGLAKMFGFGGGAAGKSSAKKAPPAMQNQADLSTQSQADKVQNANPRNPTTNQQTQDSQTQNPQNQQTQSQQPKPTNANSQQTPEEEKRKAREDKIDNFNRKYAADNDVVNNTERGRQLNQEALDATTNRNTAAQKADDLERQANEEKSKAAELLQKAQAMSEGGEKNNLMQQSQTAGQNANGFSAQAEQEKAKAKEHDRKWQEANKQLDDMAKEREKNMTSQEIGAFMKKRYGNNYRADQSANQNGWDFK